MGRVTITIDKREYAITCGDGEEAHIVQLSRLLDEKAQLLSKSVGLINENMMLAMVGLLLADEIQELKKNSSGNIESELKKADESTAKQIESEVERISALIKDIKAL